MYEAEAASHRPGKRLVEQHFNAAVNAGTTLFPGLARSQAAFTALGPRALGIQFGVPCFAETKTWHFARA